MKTLILLRHAKSSWEETALDDLDRPLNPRGRRSAKAVGASLAARDLPLELLIASPARRVRETLELMAPAIGNVPVRFEPDCYMASMATLARVIRSIEPPIECAMLGGHNPGLHQLLLELVAMEDPLRPRVEPKLPTGTAAILNLEARAWADVKAGTATVAQLIFPRDLER